MRRLFGAVGSLIKGIFDSLRQAGGFLLLAGSALVGLLVGVTNADLLPLVLPALACFWTSLAVTGRKERLDQTREKRLTGLSIAMWASFALGVALREPAPPLFALWAIGFVPVWLLVGVIVLLWPQAGKAATLIGRGGRLFEKIKRDDGTFEEKELTGWGGKEAELEIWADTAVVVDQEGTNARVLRHVDGKPIIQKSEAVRALVDLRTQMRTEEKIPTLTRDGITVEIDLYATFHIERGGLPGVEDPYPALRAAILRAVYSTAVFDDRPGGWEDWKEVPLYLLRMRLQDIVAQYALNELYEHSPDAGDGADEDFDEMLRIPRRCIAAELFDPEQPHYLRRNLGIQLVMEGTGIGTIAFPDEKVREEVLDHWRRQRDHQLNRQLSPVESRLRADRVLTLIKPVQEQFALTRPVLPEGEIVELIEGEVSPARVSAKELAAGEPIDLNEWDQDRLIDLLARLDALRAERGHLSKTVEALHARIRGILLQFVEAFDNVDMAVRQTPAEVFGRDRYALGLRGIQQDILKRFRDLGLEEVPGVAHPLDTAIHEAISRDPDSALSENTVSRVVRRGFYYNVDGERRLLRPAQVWVSTGEGSTRGISPGRTPGASPPQG